MTEPAFDHGVLHQLVAALADGELPSGEARVVQDHLHKCDRCQRELALQQGLSSALGQGPLRPASIPLRRRIQQIGVHKPRELHVRWTAWAAPVAATAMVAFGVVGVAAFVSVAVGRAGAVVASRADATRAMAPSPLLRDALADCTRVMKRNFPRRADLAAVAAGVPFSVRALDRPDARLFSTWKTTLAGSPAVGLAYHWGGIVVVQYAVAPELIQQQPEVGEALRAAGSYSASERGRGVVASLAGGSGTLLLADAPPERLRRLIL